MLDGVSSRHGAARSPAMQDGAVRFLDLLALGPREHCRNAGGTTADCV